MQFSLIYVLLFFLLNKINFKPIISIQIFTSLFLIFFRSFLNYQHTKNLIIFSASLALHSLTLNSSDFHQEHCHSASYQYCLLTMCRPVL